jgi:probable phosphoglycerate mutase
MTTFYLVRHGLTSSIGHYLPGTAEGTPLTEAGQQQAEQIGEALRDIPVAAVVASPLTRTRQTAEAIARPHQLEVTVQPAFLEFDVGAWTGKPLTELDAIPDWAHFNAVRSLVRPPGGELLVGVQARAVSALFDLASTHPASHIVVVSHGDVIKSALMFFLGMPLDFVHRMEIVPASISVVAVDAATVVVRQVNGASVRPAA